MTCDACGERIKADTASVTVNTAETSSRWHLGCCPLAQERVPEASRGGKAADTWRAT